jgi:hypothetical protein
MPAGQRPPVAATWAIRSVTVRTRDGPERLDQVYRRLTDNGPHRQPQAAADPRAGRAAAAGAGKPWR